MNNDQGVPPPGARGSGYIVFSDESGPSDQTDIDRVVFLKVLGRWSMIREVEADWYCSWAGTQGTWAGALPPGPIGLPFIPVASGVF